MNQGERVGQAASGGRSRRQMLLRGRLTLLLLVLLGIASADWLIRVAAGGESRAAADPLAIVRPAGPEPAGPPAPPLAPAQVLSRIPVTRALWEDLESRAPASASTRNRIVELVPRPDSRPDLAGPLAVEYTLDTDLMHSVFRILKRGRVALGHVIVMDPATGRVLVYASTDLERFPPDRAYPAASLVKVITAAAALHHAPEASRDSCRTVGNPYRLTRRRIDPTKGGRAVSLRRALATSNNQCFAQLAVHQLGSHNLLGAIDRFGWLLPPAPLHPAGEVEPAGEDEFALGKLGSGLSGTRITPLHAAQLAGTLARGRRTPPFWITQVRDGEGHPLLLPRQPASVVMTSDLARELREMLVDTTVRGTARRAFRTRRGPLLGPIRVAGKTGSLSGTEPRGRYEWFIGVAPADDPRVVVAAVVVQGSRWWVTPSQVAAEVLKGVFCPRGVCDPEAADRWLDPQPEPEPRPTLIASG
ncbi:MAG: penicillin-binding transpeptidase domain-containing protein [Myxococcota bacterium]